VATEKYPIIPRKNYNIPAENWNLNQTGLYSLKVVEAQNGSISISADSSASGFQEFVLPINPSNLQVSLPFAINTTPTSNGVVEEHNGVVFRNILISGTFGISPGKLRANAPTAGLGHAIGNALAPAVNTLGGVGSIATAINRTGAAVGRLPTLFNALKTDKDSLKQLGFYRINEFANWLVSYVETKKTSDGKNLRLVFIDRKNGVNYVVTPKTLDISKEASEPHLVKYRILLQGWDLATTQKKAFGDPNLPQTSGPTVLAAALNALDGARSILAASDVTIHGVLSDLENPVTISSSTINEVGLLLKDMSNTSKSIAEFDELAAAHLDSLKDAINGAYQPVNATDPSGRSSSNKLLKQTSNPLRNPKDRFKLIDILKTIPLGTISLSSSEADFVNAKLNKVRSLTLADFDTMRGKFEGARDTFTDSIGLNDPDYDATRGRIAGPKLRNATPGDFKTLQALNDMISVVDVLTANKDVTSARLVDPFVRAQRNANNPQVQVIPYNNGFPIPFPHGGTLEQLALQYLGDADLIQDIIVANGLQHPYIDEDGFTNAFVSNGSGNQFTIQDADNLYLGQEIFLSSDKQFQSRRIIQVIRKLAPDAFLIEVDGAADLNNFKVSQNAKMLAYLPNTVNSSKMIVIPTSKPVLVNLPKGRSISIVQNLDRQQKAMGVDIGLTPEFDLALNNNQDLKPVAGVANALQAVKIKLGLEKGSLKQHPDLGLGIDVGTRQAQNTDTVRASLENAILTDPRFSAITDLNIEFNGDITRLGMRIIAADGSDVIPLTFTIR
jgi:hypothetical protein